MRITVVGSGYIGQALARHWRDNPALHITLTTTTPERLPTLEPLADRVLVCRADRSEALAEALQGAEVAVFCHAPTGDSQVDAAQYRATYLDGFATLQALLPQLDHLKHLVYTGSCSVYGDAGGAWVDESTPLEPGDEHGRILLQSEACLKACRSPERTVCLLRLGAIHGPGRQLADRCARLAGSTRPGSGQHHCNWIHRDDVVGAIDAAVQQRWDDTVNVVDDHPWTVAGLLEAVCRARGLPAVQWDPSQGSASADRRISNRRLHQLGYGLQHPRVALPQLTRIDDQLIGAVAELASLAPRGRINHNLHQHPDAVQRFLNALQPGTYVRPHRHRRATPGSGFECFVVLQGAIGLVLLDAHGTVLECHRLDAGGPLRGMELAEGQFHTLVALQPDSVIFELKQGPYQPSADKDFLADFPQEGTAQAAAWEQRWRGLFQEDAVVAR
jgi:cupin fold WbuC family metalloprotein